MLLVLEQGTSEIIEKGFKIYKELMDQNFGGIDSRKCDNWKNQFKRKGTCYNRCYFIPKKQKSKWIFMLHLPPRKGIEKWLAYRRWILRLLPLT